MVLKKEVFVFTPSEKNVIVKALDKLYKTSNKLIPSEIVDIKELIAELDK